MITRWCGVKVTWAATMSRSSSSVTSSRCWFGSPPIIRTATSVDSDSSHTIGRVILFSNASGRAITIPQRSAFCIAMRLGASSPNTSVRYDSTSVTTMIDTGPAAPPRKLSGSSSGTASDTAAAAEARKPASVMPIWMVARKRFGSRARPASTAPVPDLRFQPLELPLAQRHQRQFGAGERGVDDDEQEHQGDLRQVLRHRDAPGMWRWGMRAFGSRDCFR